VHSVFGQHIKHVSCTIYISIVDFGVHLNIIDISEIKALVRKYGPLGTSVCGTRADPP